MSFHECPPPGCQGSGAGAIKLRISPKERDLGGFSVRRVLPSGKLPMLGPFIFWDQMGPAQFPEGQGMDVRPHPHIGLATITFLFEGAIMHRDSVGSVQEIRPGDVNWMTAGRGIVHSERSPEHARGGRLYGIQSWIALPADQQEVAPEFSHHPAATLPVKSGDGWQLRLIAGSLMGMRSPVTALSPIFYADLQLEPGASLSLEAPYTDRGLYPVQGRIEFGGEHFETGTMVVAASGSALEIRNPGTEPARAMLMGGEPFPEKRIIWWNFVGTSEARIDQAKADWKAQRFESVAGETEFIPLPDR
ncbi:MAG: pirin family protein [Myxococcota bacterium]